MINFTCKPDVYLNDLMELVRAFEQRTDDAVSLDVVYARSGGELTVLLFSDRYDGFRKTYRYPVTAELPSEIKRLEKRYLKMAIYNTLVFLTGVNLPYGCLTGIRPTKLYTELGADARRMFAEDFSVAPKKLELIERTVRAQTGLRNTEEGAFDVFVFIPFCPTKCAYCSFVSLPIDRRRNLIEPYTECLTKELRYIRSLAEGKGLKVRSVYVGGGTPTVLPPHLLDKILAECDYGGTEFTVEAGRPDTVTEDVLRVLKNRGVTRVSVNPQTFNDKTLEIIGRRHKAEDVERAYLMARAYGFDVNMDLIAMLPGEKFDDFRRTLDRAAEMSPENVTVHTLYLKRGSSLKTEGYRSTDNDEAERMVDYAYRALTEAGYNPYYMYRQKYTSGNLENAGYAKTGKECLYNIDIMEEDTSVLAAGAAAISKKLTRRINLIERNANYKEPLEYVKHFDTVMERQRNFWENLPYYG